MTIAEAVREASATLEAAGVDTPRLDAELLLGHVTGEPRVRLRLYPDRTLTPAQAARFADLVTRRAAREPLPYLTGTREFYGRSFIVSPAVLIPRPETELLVEAVVNWGRAEGATRMADIGAGSGAIAVTLAAELPAVTVFAVDISPAALAMTRTNAQLLQVAARIVCLEGDGVRPLQKQAITGLDAVVANLPYIPEGEMAALMPEVRDHEPSLALHGGDDGLAIIRRVIADAPSVLRPGGLLGLEVGYGQACVVAALLREAGWREVRVITDYGGIERHVLGMPA